VSHRGATRYLAIDAIGGKQATVVREGQAQGQRLLLGELVEIGLALEAELDLVVHLLERLLEHHRAGLDWRDPVLDHALGVDRDHSVELVVVLRRRSSDGDRPEVSGAARWCGMQTWRFVWYLEQDHRLSMNGDGVEHRSISKAFMDSNQ